MPVRNEAPPDTGHMRWWGPAGAAAGLLAVLPLALLAFAAWNSRWVRPGGDDWCFIPVVRDGGLSAMVGKFYFHDNGRLANAVLVWAYARFGEAGQRWFAPVSGLLMLAMLWAFAAAVLHAARLRAPRGAGLLAASMVTVLFLLGSPNTYKTFYWPAASVSHTLPPVLACAAAIPVLRASTRRGRILALLTVVIAGVSLGLLSEETSIVVCAVLACALLISGRAFPEARREYLRTCSAAGILSVVIGILVLYTSPGSLHRREKKHAGTMLTADSLRASLHAFREIAAAVLTTWPYLGAVAAGVILGLLIRGPLGRRAPGKTDALVASAGVCALLVSGYVCTVITYPVFGRGVVTSTRLWNDYLLLYILLLVYAGTLLTRTLRSRALPTPAVRKGVGVLGAVAAATVCVLACVTLTTSLSGLGSQMRTHAQLWDAQDQRMRDQAAAGAQVLPYTPLHLSKMTEPFRHHGRAQWPASCIADYYGVRRITHAPPTSHTKGGH
ncbi:DUF6056 family protein [Streptomyces sp. NPDC058045]|uniref:DUF6056 family protein n=1 Tax=Streptomyces sp. NPDC058045 TaxID=3346311 RepID=UPI0036E5B8CA